MPATISAQPKQPVRPVAPMPLWERERLFREPEYPPVDEDDDSAEAA